MYIWYTDATKEILWKHTEAFVAENSFGVQEYNIKSMDILYNYMTSIEVVKYRDCIIDMEYTVHGSKTYFNFIRYSPTLEHNLCNVEVSTRQL